MNAEEKRGHPRQKTAMQKAPAMLSSFTGEPGMRWPKSVSRETSAGHGGPERKGEATAGAEQRVALLRSPLPAVWRTRRGRMGGNHRVPRLCTPAPRSLSQTPVQRMWLHEDVGEAEVIECWQEGPPTSGLWLWEGES